MADEKSIDFRDLTSNDSKIEAIAIASNRPSSRITSAGANLSWHPKLTPYRFLVILSTIGLAAAKIATSHFNFSFVSIALEWILGVIVFLSLCLLGAYKRSSNRYFPWLFNFDCMEYLWKFLEKFTGFSRPHYISDEIDPRHRMAGTHPSLTGYRIIITLVVASVALTKFALAYGKEPMEMEVTTGECVFGVGIATALYWLGLYESSSIKVYPKLFHVDYSGGGLSYISEAAIVFLYLSSLLPCIALCYGSYVLASMLLSGETFEKSDGMVEIFAKLTLIGSLSTVMFLGGASGVVYLLYHLGWRYRVSPLARSISRLPALRVIPYIHQKYCYVRQKYWLPSGTPLHPRPRFFYLKRFILRQCIKIPLNCAQLYLGTMLFMYWPGLSFLGLYSTFMDLLRGSPWYWLLLYSLLVFPLVYLLGMLVIAWVYLGCKGVVNYFLDAWKDFTVEIEPGGVPEASFEGV